MINEALFAKALGNLFGLFMLGFKGVDQVQANEVGHLTSTGMVQQLAAHELHMPGL